MVAGNFLKNLPSTVKEEIFETLVDCSQVKIERIISLGHRSPKIGWYHQEQHEWVMVISGSATIEFEDGTKHGLSSNDFINIPANKKHKVIWTDTEQQTVWLAIHY